MLAMDNCDRVKMGYLISHEWCLFPRNGSSVLTQLAQRLCNNVVTTSWLTLSQRCGTVENESCGDVAVQRCQDVATTLLQRRHNIIWFLGHFIMDNLISFSPSKRERVTKVLEY